MDQNVVPLWDHQRKAIEKGLGMDHLGIFFDIGTGKSRTAIDLIRQQCAKDGKLLKTLILAPKIVLTNWKREFAKYSKIHQSHIIVLLGSKKKRMNTMAQECGLSGSLTESKILLTNYEAMDMEELVEMIKDWKPDIMIADEAHRLKNPESKRAKEAIKVSDFAKYKYALTGSPILNSAMDIFNIFRFLDGGETFGKNFYAFRTNWFEDANAGWAGKTGHFPKYQPRPETYIQLAVKVAAKSVQAKKSECLDLPPFLRQQVFVELSVEQQKLYKQMRDEFVAYVDGLEAGDQPRAVIAQLAITKALRLQQIVTGYAKTDDGSIHKIKDNPRLKALEEMLAELSPNHKIIVWSVFHENYHDISELCKKLKISYGELHGKISQANRESSIAAFNSDPKCRVLIANQGAGGIGINLVSSDVSIYYSKNFSLEHDIQSEGRNYRGGSEIHEKVTRIDIIAQDTIDDLISQALADKQDISKQILDWKRKV